MNLVPRHVGAAHTLVTRGAVVEHVRDERPVVEALLFELGDGRLFHGHGRGQDGRGAVRHERPDDGPGTRGEEVRLVAAQEHEALATTTQARGRVLRRGVTTADNLYLYSCIPWEDLVDLDAS